MERPWLKSLPSFLSGRTDPRLLKFYILKKKKDRVILTAPNPMQNKKNLRYQPQSKIQMFWLSNRSCCGQPQVTLPLLLPLAYTVAACNVFQCLRRVPLSAFHCSAVVVLLQCHPPPFFLFLVSSFVLQHRSLPLFFSSFYLVLMHYRYLKFWCFALILMLFRFLKLLLLLSFTVLYHYLCDCLSLFLHCNIAVPSTGIEELMVGVKGLFINDIGRQTLPNVDV